MCLGDISLNWKLFFFPFLLGPPLLISRLITSRQLLQAGAEKRKFVGFRHISQICVTLLVWKKFRCKKGAEHTNTDLYLLMNATVSQAYDRAAKTNKCTQNESIPCGPAHLQHSHVVLSKEAYHSTSHSWLGLRGRQEILGTSTSDAGMGPAVPVPIAVQQEGCLVFLSGATGMVLQNQGSAALASLICHNTICLPPSILVFCTVWGTTAEQDSLHPSGFISAASFCSSRPPSLATSSSPSGHWFWFVVRINHPQLRW